jgi:hypothetical protein
MTASKRPVDFTSCATPRMFDFSFPASLAWPEREWYQPEGFKQTAQQHAISGRRAQGLPDKISDPVVVGKIAALIRGGRRG